MGTRALLGLLLGGLLSGCVTMYQPQVSLQRPVVVDPEVGNFDGMKILVRCVPGEYLEQEDATRLCRNLKPLFVNQGATVETEVPSARGLPRDEPAVKPDLIIDLNARLLHDENSIMLWILSIGTLTLLPAITEYTFAQDVTVRDSSGFLLGTDVLQARFVRYFGLGSLLVTWGLDLVARAKSEKLSGSGFNEEFSKDFYGQLSQIAFHAKMRSVVLHSFEVEPDPKPPTGKASTAPSSTAPPLNVPPPITVPPSTVPDLPGFAPFPGTKPSPPPPPPRNTK